ncbi:MAG TPA: EAL domain-containing protein [Solirubrobacteraceae bacterium]|nr:EAL domain-containing protein [Solirubrobacteraceae bacterium]
MISDPLLRMACEQAPGGMSVTSLDGECLWSNEAFCALVGHPAADLLGMSSRQLVHPDDVRAHDEFRQIACAGRRDRAEGEKRYVRSDGCTVWTWTGTQIIRGADGAPVGFVAHVHDVTGTRRARELLLDSERTLRAVIDNTPALISVKGRDHRYRLVNRDFELAHGRSAGWIVGRSDADLIPASRLRAVRAKDLAVLDSGVGSQEEETTIDATGVSRVQLNSRFPLPGADGAVEAVCLASTDITERLAQARLDRERLKCSALIYSALAEDRYVLYGQPIAALHGPGPDRVELLVRMQDAPGSATLRSPAAFLPAAERFGLIRLIDEWVIDQAIALAATHRVTANVSALTVCSASAVDRIEAALIAGPVPAGQLVFEITETAVADDLDAARRFATRMRALGCAIALDDFGVGHGSFTYLRHLPLDYLKIDIQFVRELLKDTENLQVVMAIIGVARQFGLETIAEGVEDQATLDELSRCGVDYVQGLHIGAPVPLSVCFADDRPRPGAENV